jgi:hypothetical protein
VLVDSTSRALLVDSRLAKLRDVWLTLLDTWWHSAAWKEPMLDIVRCPFSDIHTTAIVVQRFAVVIWDCGCLELGSTARIAINLNKAIRSLQRRSLVTTCD